MIAPLEDKKGDGAAEGPAAFVAGLADAMKKATEQAKVAHAEHHREHDRMQRRHLLILGAWAWAAIVAGVVVIRLALYLLAIAFR